MFISLGIIIQHSILRTGLGKEAYNTNKQYTKPYLISILNSELVFNNTVMIKLGFHVTIIHNISVHRYD